MASTLKKLTPNLMVEDVNRTIDFYKELLGFLVLATVPDEGQFNWAMLGRDDVVLMFQARASLAEDIPSLAGHQIGGSLSFYTDVTGISELYEQLRGRVEIVRELHTTFYSTQEFAIRDCNSYVLSFSEAVAASEAAVSVEPRGDAGGANEPQVT